MNAPVERGLTAQRGAAGFLARYHAIRGNLPGDSSLRAAAADAFRIGGLPGGTKQRRTEAWKYTSLRPVAETTFQTNVDTPGQARLKLAQHHLPQLARPRLIFVDGQFCPALSEAPAGFARFADQPDFGTLTWPDREPLVALDQCQVLMLRMMSDIVPALLAACDGQLGKFDLRWYPQSALTVVMAAKGYPGDYDKGTRIEGIEDAAKIEGVEIFHAGTTAKDGHILANGGRVLNVCALGSTVAEAQQRAYQAVDRIKWPEGFCRRDIAWQAVEQEKNP